MTSLPVFPALAGQGWSIIKRPTWSTRIASHVSGREVRAPLYVYPLYEFEATFDGLASNSSFPGLGANSLQSLMGLYLQCQGQFGTFFYTDPTDNFVTAQPIGTGTGAQTAFTLARTLGGYTEPVSWAVRMPRVTLNGTEQAQYHLSEDTSTGGHAVFKSAGPFTIGTTVTVSVYVKADQRSACRLQLPDGVSSPDIEVNLATGVSKTNFFPASTSVQSVGNGWYLITISIVRQATGSNNIALYAENPYLTPTYTGTSGSGIFFSSPTIAVGTGSPEPLTGFSDVGATHVGPNWSMTQPNTLTFASAPGNGVAVAADISYGFQCRFLDDQAEFEQFMSNLWKVQALKFRSVRAS